MQAPSSPPQLGAVAGVFARLQHRTVVVPELLNALGSQVGCLLVLLPLIRQPKQASKV
jgi:hypothetical protein